MDLTGFAAWLDTVAGIARVSPVVIALILPLALLAYYTILWLVRARVPGRRHLPPTAAAPAGVSPAAARYLLMRGYDHRALAAALLHLGITGALTLSENDVAYAVRRADDAYDIDDAGPALRARAADGRALTLPPEERNLAQTLVGRARAFRFVPERFKAVRSAAQEFARVLTEQYDGTLLRHNSTYVTVGVAGTSVALVIMLLMNADPLPLLGVVRLALAAVLLQVAVLWARSLVPAVRDDLVQQEGQYGRTFSGLPPLLGPLALLACAFLLLTGAPPLVIAGLSVIALLHGAFRFLLDAPTVRGRQVLDELAALRRYLRGEVDTHAPEITGALFERLLPYAVALGEEDALVARCMPVLMSPPPGAVYFPAWFYGMGFSHGAPRAFGSLVGRRLVAAITRATHPPSAAMAHDVRAFTEVEDWGSGS